MKALTILVSSILILVAAGCRSQQSHPTPMTSNTQMITPQAMHAPTVVAQQAATNSGPKQIVTDTAIYTIEVIPNPRLSATSREGDKTNQVYSSNIVAVHMHPRYGANVNSTNSPATPGPGDNPPPRH